MGLALSAGRFWFWCFVFSFFFFSWAGWGLGDLVILLRVGWGD